MTSSRLKLLLLAMGIMPLSVLISPVPDANAVCLDVQPPIWITRNKAYFNIYPSWRSVDDHVKISGLVRLDVIDEGRYESRVLIEIWDDNGTMVKSHYAALNLTDGSFVYNFPLWVDNTIPDDPNYHPYNKYLVKATYGLYQADWRFVLTPAQPSGINELNFESLVITDVSGNNITDHRIRTGQQVKISAAVENNVEIPLKGLPFFTVLLIRDSNGIDSYMGLQSSILISGCSTEFGFSWMPEEEGQYKMIVFAVDGWRLSNNSSQLLSDVSSAEILVTG